VQTGIELKKGEGSVIRLKQANSPTGESKFWYILYYASGRQVRENTKVTDYREAYDLLVKRKADVARGEQPAFRTSAVRYEELRDILIADYTTKGKTLFLRSDGVKIFPGRVYLDKFFKGMTASRITTAKIREYIGWCQDQDLEDPTIRRHLVCLRSAFGLAVKEGRLLHVPYFPMPKDSEPAGQYINPETYEKLLDKMPEASKPFFTFLYYTSCRTGAARKITWDMVNRDATEIKLPAEIVKQNKPLTIVLAGKGLDPVSTMLRKMFRHEHAQVLYTTNFRKEWYKACHAIGLGVYESKTCRFTGPRIHDFRCSAAINMIDAGVPQDIVMKIGGWKTISMFSRYNVINTERIRNAMILGGEYVARQMQGTK
jgi:integrase